MDQVFFSRKVLWCGTSMSLLSFSLFVNVHTWARVCVRVREYVWGSVCFHVYMCMRLTHMCAYKHDYTCVYIRRILHVHVHTCVRMCVRASLFLKIWICRFVRLLVAYVHEDVLVFVFLSVSIFFSSTYLVSIYFNWQSQFESTSSWVCSRLSKTHIVFR